MSTSVALTVKEIAEVFTEGFVLIMCLIYRTFYFFKHGENASSDLWSEKIS